MEGFLSNTKNNNINKCYKKWLINICKNICFDLDFILIEFSKKELFIKYLHQKKKVTNCGKLKQSKMEVKVKMKNEK